MRSPRGHLKLRLLSNAQPQYFLLKQFFCSLMFRSGSQSHSVWCTEGGGGGGRRGQGGGGRAPALSFRSFRANSVLPFHPWLVRNSASCGLSFHSARIMGIRGKWCQWLGFMASNAELPNIFFNAFLKFCDSLVHSPCLTVPQVLRRKKGDKPRNHFCLGEQGRK